MKTMRLVLTLLFLSALLTAQQVRAANDTFSTEELFFGFENTVFGLEYRIFRLSPYYVKKYTQPVRFYVHNLSARDRRATVRNFVREVGRRVNGLSTGFARSPAEANFEVYVVDRRQYEAVGRKNVFKNDRARVPGLCLVRVISGRQGIKRSIAVIVSDEGEARFRRCLVEEILQGLGPMNDNDKLRHSVFNDSSNHNRFTVFDQLIMNMLYDPRIKPGMTVQQARQLLPIVTRDARRRVR